MKTWVVDWNPLWKHAFWLSWVRDRAKYGQGPFPSAWQETGEIVSGVLVGVLTLCIAWQWAARTIATKADAKPTLERDLVP